MVVANSHKPRPPGARLIFFAHFDDYLDDFGNSTCSKLTIYNMVIYSVVILLLQLGFPFKNAS